MSKRYTTLASLLLALLAIGQVFWLLMALEITINGISLPPGVAVVGLVLMLLASVGTMIEVWRRAPASAETTPRETAISRDVQRRPGKFTVHSGKRYKATISLSFFEQMASNDMIAGKLEEAGFADVHVTGAGDTRIAIGRWSGKDATAAMPSQVIAATEIVEPTVVASLTKAAATLGKAQP